MKNPINCEAINIITNYCPCFILVHGVLKIDILADHVYLIIGNKKAIQEIQNVTHTIIEIFHNRFIPNSTATTWITGDKQNCEGALMLICKKVNESIYRLNCIEEIFPTPAKEAERIKDSTTKRAIEKLSGARIKVDLEDNLFLSLLVDRAYIAIKGSWEQVERAI